MYRDESTVSSGDGDAPDAGSSSPDAQARRVLIVDDNRDSAESLGALIELYGHQVAISHDGLDALDVARRFRPHIALLDLDLPRLSGYEVAERLRAEAGTKTVLLVALTGYGGLEDKNESRARGFDEHLTKPADFKRLFALIAASPSQPDDST